MVEDACGGMEAIATFRIKGYQSRTRDNTVFVFPKLALLEHDLGVNNIIVEDRTPSSSVESIVRGLLRARQRSQLRLGRTRLDAELLRCHDPGPRAYRNQIEGVVRRWMGSQR